MTDHDRRDLSERLVHVRSSDGLELAGACFAGRDDTTCIVWINGFGVSYDFPAYVLIGRLMARYGVGFLSCSVRGQHGGVTGWCRHGNRLRLVRVGSWYEVFEESAWDIQAWVEYAAAAGYQRIVLAGHSFGALKVLHYAGGACSGIRGLVLASPGRGLEKALGGDLRDVASELVAAGRGEELLPAGSWPNGFGTDTISAQTYVSWTRVAQLFYGRDTSYLSAIALPVLCWYGGSGDVGNSDDLKRLAMMMPQADVDVRVLDGVHHHCLGGERRIARTLMDWTSQSGLVGG